MTSNRISQIVALMRRHAIAEFEFEHGDTRIRLSSSGTPAGAAPVSGASHDSAVIRSPGIGRFHLAHPFSAEEAQRLPRRVRKGEIVAYLSIGAMLRPVPAPRDCTLQALLAEDGAITGYDDPLFSL